MEKTLTLLEAYKAMVVFIDNFYMRGGNQGELDFLLMCIKLLDDDKPADPAMWQDWLDAVKESGENNTYYLNFHQ
jgi:hypothetical protein